MAANYFIGKDETWLLAALSAVQSELGTGKFITLSTSGDVSVNARIGLTPEVVFERLGVALNAINPETYPLSSFIRITRTVPVFSL